MSQFINTSELDFLNYRNSLKEFLKTQQAFKDYDFEGSNLSVLLDILALNTLNNAYYENMVGSEMFLDTAVLKDSIVSRCKELNYLPRSRTAARTSVSIEINTGNSTPSEVTIPKYYNIKAFGSDGEVGTKEYNFVTNSAIVIQSDSLGNYIADDVEIFQGVVVNEAFVANTNSRYILQANTVDVNSIVVTIQTSNSNVSTVEFEKADNIYGLNGESNVFFVQPYNDDRYEIQFGNGVIGKSITNGNIVRVSYISTEGDLGNDIQDFRPTVAVDGYAVQSIIADQKTYGGSEREDIASIKFQAPRNFTVQERAVIESDFETLVRSKFPIVQSVKAYGGERLFPPQYGRVALFIKPFGLEGVISDVTKDEIVTYLNSKSLTTQTFIVDPEYFYVKVDSKVYYDINKLNKSIEQLKSNILLRIEEFGQDNLTDFDSDFRYSKFVKYIDDTDVAIVSNDTTVQIIKRWSPVTGQLISDKFSFGSALKNYALTREIESAELAVVTSSPFFYVLDGISYAAKIEDNGRGILRLITTNANRTILNSNIGTVNYATGEVSLNLNISSYSGYISIHAKPNTKDLTVAENRFLILDVADSNITLEKEQA